MTKLKNYLLERGIKFSHFQEEIGMSRTGMSLLLSGKTLPSLMMAYIIEKKTRGYVTAYDWINDHKRIQENKDKKKKNDKK